MSYIWDRLEATRSLCPVRKILVLLDEYLEAEVAGVVQTSLSVTANHRKQVLGSDWPLESAACDLHSKALIFRWLLSRSAFAGFDP